MAVLGAVALGTAVVQGISSIRRGRRQEQLARQRAEQKRRQQEEIARRTQSEIALIRSAAKDAVGEATTRYAGAGIDVGSGASVQAQMQSFENMGRVIMNKQYEAAFRIDQLALEERWELKQGQEMRQASVIDAVGGLISTGININRASGG